MTQNNIQVIECEDKNEASQKALDILLQVADHDTLLLLSGGASPDILYRLVSRDKTLRPGAVALIDERFGLPMHDNSNEKMISDTGLMEYLNNKGIPFYKILKEDSMGTVTTQYEQVVKDLFKKFPKKVAVMGIGADGHTAGVKPDLEYDHHKFVVSYNDAEGTFGQRITLTFEALECVDEFIILVFGESKKEALEEMFEGLDKKKIPAVFYANNPSKVTILTTLIASSILKE